MTFICLCLIGFGVWTLHAKLNQLRMQLCAIATPRFEQANCDTVSVEPQKNIHVQQQIGMGIGLVRLAWRIIQARL
jgi:hypothetical protein